MRGVADCEGWMGQLGWPKDCCRPDRAWQGPAGARIKGKNSGNDVAAEVAVCEMAWSRTVLEKKK